MDFRFGYRAVEEQHQPNVLIQHAIKAEKLGFDFVCTSDHFHPWFHENGCASQAWIWLSSAASRTSKISLGTGVTVPLFRYHPAITAQAFATLGHMFPNRIFLGVGTGEAMNEVPLGFDWPNFKERVERLEESIHIIKKLWTGNFVNFIGKHYLIREAKLYTPPIGRVPIYVAAEGKKAATLAGKLGDAYMGFDIGGQDKFNKVFEGLRDGCSQSGKDFNSFPKMIEMKISYNEDFEKALKSLEVWRVMGVDRSKHDVFKLSDPRELDKLANQTSIDSLIARGYIYTNLEDLCKKIEQNIKMGFNEIQVGSSSPDELSFLEEFGKKALPYLKERYQPSPH